MKMPIEQADQISGRIQAAWVVSPVSVMMKGAHTDVDGHPLSGGFGGIADFSDDGGAHVDV